MATRTKTVARREQTLPSVKGYTPEQVALVKNTVAARANLTDDELVLFLTTAQRRGLDPFAKQLYAIKYDNKTLSLVTGIDGYRSVAARVKEDGKAVYAGSDEPEFEETVQGSLYAAKVTVYRMVGGQRCPFVGYAVLKEFARTSNEEWRKQPRNMLAKCAEAQALKKAFPEELADLGYTETTEFPPPQPRERAATPSDDATVYEGPAALVHPWGNQKGRLLGDCSDEMLSRLLKWCEEKDPEKFATYVQGIPEILEERRIGRGETSTG